MKNNQIIMVGLIVAIVGAGGFFAGMQYEKSQRRSMMMGGMRDQMGGQMGQGNRMFGNSMGRTGGNRPVMGEIISQDETSVTVKMDDGSTKIVMISDSTSINKATTGTKIDLKTGEKVLVIGTSNSDGSVTAQTVQLNPMMGRMSDQKMMPSPTK